MVINKRAVHSLCNRGAGGLIQHVPMAEQRLSPTLIDDGARIDLGRDLKGDTGRYVSLDQTCDDIH